MATDPDKENRDPNPQTAHQGGAVEQRVGRVALLGRAAAATRVTVIGENGAVFERAEWQTPEEFWGEIHRYIERWREQADVIAQRTYAR